VCCDATKRKIDFSKLFRCRLRFLITRKMSKKKNPYRNENKKAITFVSKSQSARRRKTPETNDAEMDKRMVI
jgi:hypothetical protein